MKREHSGMEVYKRGPLNKTLTVIFLVFIICTTNATAQFISAKVGINGLTCSLCSMGVEKSLLKLPFIAKVTMDLNTNLADITFKDPSIIDMSAVAKKITDAGFSVRSVEGFYKFNDLLIYNESSFIVNGSTYIFIGVQKQILDEVHPIKFIGKKFMEPKEFTKWKDKIKPLGMQTNSETKYFITL